MTETAARVSVESVCLKVSSGGTPSRKVQEYWDGGDIPWVKTGELKDTKLFDTEEKITIEGLENSSAKKFPINTVLMAMYGDGKTITSLGVLEEELATNQACCAMIADPAKCYYKFLYYSLMQNRYRLLGLVVAGAQRNLSIGIIKRFEIDYFPLPIQHSIGDLLSKYDDLIENNKRRIELLEESARQLYKEWFVRFRFPGHEHVKIIDGVPEGWRKFTFGEAPIQIVDGDRGKNYPKQDEFFVSGHCLFLSTKNVTKSGFNFTECQFITEAKDDILRKGRLSRGDVVMTTRGTIGNVAYFNKNVPYENLRINSGMVIFRVNSEKLSPSFLYEFLRSDEFSSLVNGLKSGAAQPQLPIRDIKIIELFLPTPALMEQFDDIFKLNHEQISKLNHYNQQLSRARDVLLPKLMSGEVAV